MCLLSGDEVGKKSGSKQLATGLIEAFERYDVLEKDGEITIVGF